MHRAQVEADVRNAARALAAFARARDAERKELRADPRVTPEFLHRHDTETAAKRAEMGQRLRSMVAEFREVGVLKAMPDFRPSSAPHASWLAGIASQAPHFSPKVMKQQIENAIANDDRAAVALLLPLAESYSEYKNAFANTVTGVIIEAQNYLRQAPAVVASDQNAAFCDAAAQEAIALETVLKEPRPSEALDTYLLTDAFPTLLPK